MSSLSRSSEITAILSAQSVRIALANAIVVRSTVLAVVGTIGLGPRLRVHAAIGALGYVVDGEDIGIEEVLLISSVSS